MKTIDEIKAQIKSDMNDPVQGMMITMCGGFHPLSDFRAIINLEKITEKYNLEVHVNVS